MAKCLSFYEDMYEQDMCKDNNGNIINDGIKDLRKNKNPLIWKKNTFYEVLRTQEDAYILVCEEHIDKRNNCKRSYCGIEIDFNKNSNKSVFFTIDT